LTKLKSPRGGKKKDKKPKEEFKRGTVSLSKGEEVVEKFAVIKGNNIKVYENDKAKENDTFSLGGHTQVKYVEAVEDEEHATIEIDVKLVLKVDKEELEGWKESIGKASGEIKDEKKKDNKKDKKDDKKRCQKR